MNYNTPEILRKVINCVVTTFDEEFPMMTEETHKIMYNWNAPEQYSEENATYMKITCLSLNTEYKLSFSALNKTYGYQCEQTIMKGSRSDIVDKLQDDNFLSDLITIIEKLHESLDERMERIR